MASLGIRACRPCPSRSIVKPGRLPGVSLSVRQCFDLWPSSLRSQTTWDTSQHGTNGLGGVRVLIRAQALSGMARECSDGPEQNKGTVRVPREWFNYDLISYCTVLLLSLYVSFWIRWEQWSNRTTVLECRYLRMLCSCSRKICLASSVLSTAHLHNRAGIHDAIFQQACYHLSVLCGLCVSYTLQMYYTSQVGV